MPLYLAFSYRLLLRVIALLICFHFCSSTVHSQAVISQVNTSYPYDFNSLSYSSAASLPTGFRIGSDWSTGSIITTQSAGTSGIGILNSTSAGGCYNFGNGVTATATDRALGFLSSTSYASPRSIIYALSNSTGQTITSLTLTWNYEKYRSGTRAFNWTFFHGNTTTVSTAFPSGDLSYSGELSNTVVYNPPSSISKSVTISGLSIPDGTTYYLRWTYTGVGGSTNGQGLAIDDFKIAANRESCTTPISQPTGLAFSNTGVSSVDVSFTASALSADDYLVLTSLDNTLAISPSNGVDYQVGDVIGDATVVHAGASNTFTASGLTASTTYYFFVFAYNSQCSGGPLYNSSSPLAGNATTLAGIPACSTPATLASGLNLTATATSVSGFFSPSSSVNAYLIVYSTATTPSGSPTNGTEYVVGQSALGGTVAQANNGASFIINGLHASTSYKIFVYSINLSNCTGGPVYSTSYASGSITTASYPICSGIGLSAAPTSLSLSINESSVNGSFTAAAGADHYLVVRSTSSSLTATPVNGQSYSIGAALGNGIVVGYNDNTGFTAAGLNASTTYYFFVFSAASNCSASPTPPLYYTTALQGTATTLSSSYQYYFGNFHSHTGYSDGNKDGNAPTPTEAYNFAKTAIGMNFLGVSEHNHVAAGGSLSTYQSGITKASQFNSANSNFLALFGMEWGTISGGGHVLVYGDGLNDLLGWDPNEYSVYVPKSDYLSSTGLFKTINDYSGNSGLAILAHPSSTDYESLTSLPYNSTIDDAIVGVALETGPAFSTNTTYSDPGSSMAFLPYYRKLLSIGYRVGPVVDHDNHYTTFGKTTYSRTAVISNSLSRNGIITAMRNMRFYATQDYDAKVDFKINGRIMGSEFSDRYAPAIYVNITDASHSADLSTATIKVMSGTPGSNNVATQLTSVNGSTLSYVNNAQQNFTTNYYYLDITIGTRRIITAPIWYNRNDATILPVKLSAFNAYRKGKRVELEWTTEQEIDASHFVVERSVDGRRWDSVRMVQSQGNSAVPVHYQVYDDAPLSGSSFYRLKQVDLDGRYVYSLVRRVFVQEPGDLILSPNPTSSGVALQFINCNAPEKRIQILGADGLVKLDQVYRSDRVEISLKRFPAGTYYVRTLTVNGILLRSFVHVAN
jgi:hypothetical protein